MMKLWTPHHQALLDALHSAQLLPRLLRRLSLERHSADEDELKRLNPWPALLMRQPGWSAIEPMLDSPRAWPDAWQRAVELGFSPACDHHHALLFSRQATRALREDDLDLAEWSAQQAFDAWCRVLSTPYMLGLLDDIVEHSDDPATQAERRSVLTHLLDPHTEALAHDLSEALGLKRHLDASQPASLLRRRAALAITSLRAFAHKTASLPDPCGTLQSARTQAITHIERLQQEAAQRFSSMLSDLDPATATPDALLAPFLWAEQISHLLGPDDPLVIPIISEGVDLGWTLRRLKRDQEERLLYKLVDAILPLNDALERRLLSRESLGHNSKCADLLVFRGEEDKAGKQRRYYDRALAVCPGHRNASLLISYELLHEAAGLITRSHAPQGLLNPNDPISLIKQAHEKVEQAASLYPSNKELERHRELVREQAKRHNLTL
jgi:hypothetical protein